MRAHFGLFILCSLVVAAQQQTPPPKSTTPLAFDVATIKQSPALDPSKVMKGQVRLGAKIDGARAEYNFMSLSDLICNAYKIKPYQLSGPDWVKTQRWDIQATLPDGAPADQAPQMLQALLKERFKLEIHRDTKEHNLYALVQGKNGHKMKDAEPEAPPPPPAAVTSEPGADPKGEPAPAKDEGAPKDGKGREGATMTVNGQKITMKPTADGALVRGGKMGTTKVAMKEGGLIHMSFSSAEMPALVEMLSTFVDRPILDETGLKGKYQVELDLAMADMMNAARQSGMLGAMGGGPPPGAGGGGGAGTGGARPAESASDPGGSSSIFTAVEQMGLKLTPRKGPIETVVVDHLEKTPTEN
jgi:uncharacterized protein (TIGR03435 family)